MLTDVPPTPPEAIAVIDVDGVHARQRFDEHVGAVVAVLASRLDARGAVAVRGSHGLAVLAAIQGALHGAARVVFLDPAQDLARITPILEALDVSVILDATGEPGAHGGFDVVDVCALAPATAPAGGPLACTEYAILTTGTTGEPKVILQSLANLRGHIGNYARYLGVGPGDRVLQLASAGWDAGLMDLFVCLWHGGVLCSINPRAHDVAAVRGFIAEHAIDVLHMTVPYFRLAHADPTAGYPAPVRLVLGGELIVRRDLERFEQVAPPGSVVFNAYGPTECTTALYHRHRVGDRIVGDTFALAYPVDDVTTRIVEGELWIASPLVARRFDPGTRRAEPIDTAMLDGVGHYATGDLAHQDDDGRIVITGRRDTVIKVAGQKVSLHEVETAVRGLPEVGDACVLARPGELDATVIAAIVPADPGADPAATERAIRRALAERLAAHKLPKQVLLVAALPLNQNNKIDRAQLLAIAAVAGAAVAGAAPADVPASPLVAELRKVFRGAAIDPALSFLENGGDSLRALSVVAALKRRGFRLTLEALFSATPVGALVVEAHGAGAASAPPPNAPAALPNRAFLESRGIPDLDRWTQSIVLDVRAPVTPATILDVVTAVLARHASSWQDAVPSIALADTADLDAAVVATEASISRAGGHLCAARVIAGEPPRLILSSHQFHIDRASWLVLIAELSDGLREGAAAVRAWAPPRPDFATWTALYQQHRAAERASDLWASLPWGRGVELAPPGAPFPPREAFHRRTRTLGAAAARVETTSDALLAATLTGLAASTGARHQQVDVLGHGRDLTIDGVDPHGVVGWFTVIHPIVLAIAETPADVMAAVTAHTARTRGLTHTFGNEHHGGPGPHRDVSFNFLGDVELAATAELAVHPRSRQTMHGAASHRLEVTGYIERGVVELVIDHDPGVVDDATATRLEAAIAAAYRALEPA